MESIPHYGPWANDLPRAELTPEEKIRHDEAVKQLFKPDPERQKQMVEDFTRAMDDFKRREKLPKEEQEREMREYYEKHPILYSPPYPPVDPLYHQIWSAILSLGILDVQIVKENGQLGVIFHKNQTISLEKGKFYPLVPNGGEEQQKAFGKS